MEKENKIILNEGTENQEELSFFYVDDIEEYARANHYISFEEFLNRISKLA